jgi:hypothetical protein
MLVSGGSTYFRQANEVMHACYSQFSSLTRVQGIGRKIGARLDRLGREATVIQGMFAMLSAQSPDTSLSDYALDADVFRGILPEDKSAWTLIGLTQLSKHPATFLDA